MKKLLFSVFALTAILGVSSASAQNTTLTVEKLWSITQPGGGAARQGFGMDGALYYHQQGTGVYKVTAAAAAPELVISKEVTGIAAHAVAKDDVGNIVIFGSTGFPTGATTINFIYVQKKGETTGVRITSPTLEGFNRTDFIAAAGDVFSEEGGHLYLINNNGAAAYDITIVNGTTATVTPIAGMTLGTSQNAMMDVHDGIYHYAAAGHGVYSFDGTTATKVDGLTDIQAQCLGTTHFTLAGKEVWAYHVGGYYTSEFKILNKTDNNFVTDSEGNTVFVLNDVSKASGGALRGVWLNAEQIDDNTYLLYAWHSHDGGAVYKVSAVVAATVTLDVNDPAMGTVEGAGDYAVGSNATVKAIPALDHSFVAWKIGNAVVSTDAEYTFTVTGNVALTAVFQAEDNKTLSLSVNDETKGYITLPEGIVMGENTVAYGTQVTLTAVPAEGATFNGWYNADTLYAADYTIELVMTADLALTANFIDVLKVEYILNGGVTNKHGWLSKAHMCLDFQNDYNTAYHSSKAWAKEENGTVYYYIKGEWKLPEEVEGTDAGIDGFIQAVTFNMSDNLVELLQTEKWLPLGEYINSLRTAAGNAIADEAAMRAELSGFFLNSPALTDYRHTNDYSIAGQPSVFCPAMKMGFDNPTEVARQVTLNNPYNPYFDFVGWYTNAEFTGEKVTILNPKSVIPDGKLYAKYEGYIPTIAEVLAMEEDSVTLISGIVNWVRNNNVFIQDATGGFLLYGTDLTPEIGTNILAHGTHASFNGKPQLSNTIIISSSEGELFEPVTTTLAELITDTTSLKYFGQRVKVWNVYVAEYDSYGNLWVADKDGTNKTQCYYMTPNQAQFPVGKKINLTAVASTNNGIFQFEGDMAGIEDAIVKEQYEYPSRADGKYTLENNWIISHNENNFTANKPGNTDYVRGMAAKDGIMYFINRETESIVRVDGATGEMLDPIVLQDKHLFEKVTGTDNITGEPIYSPVVTYGYNDIQFDSNGNCLIGSLTSKGDHFMIYQIDLTTAEATLLVDERLWDNPNYDQEMLRFDAFGVAGDVTKDGVIMAADATDGNWRVYRWLINDGVASKGEQINILLDPEVDQSLFINANGLSTAPRIYPLDELGELFYVDGYTTLPMLFSSEADDATLIDDFINVPSYPKVWNAEGDTLAFLSTGQNGLVEFQVGDDYFLLMSASHFTNNIPSTFALYKFADAERSFSGMEPLWYFPAKGMGSMSNGCRTSVPSVDVIDESTAILYLYTHNNGYASYTLKIDSKQDITTSVEDFSIVNNSVEKLIRNGQLLIIRDGKTYNVMGAEMK